MRNSVFIGGSRAISKLPSAVIARLENIVKKELPVVIGDAIGADLAVQTHLDNARYRNVIVYCVRGHCRNNAGLWATCSCTPLSDVRDFSYYSSKDLQMALDASYGFMIWDGKSAGTLNNVMSLVKENKPVLVYFEPDKVFHTLRTVSDLPELIIRCSKASLAQFDRKLSLSQFLKMNGETIGGIIDVNGNNQQRSLVRDDNAAHGAQG